MTREKEEDMGQYCAQGYDDPGDSHGSADSQLASAGPQY